MTNSISFLRVRAKSRTTRGNRPKTFLIGCIRVFMTAPCRSAVTTSRLATAFDISSSLLAIPRLTKRLRTNTNSPTIFMITSSVLVSTRTVVSLCTALFSVGAGAVDLAAAGAAGLDGDSAGFAEALVTGLDAGVGTAGLD